MKRIDDSFGRALARYFLPFAPIWVVLAFDKSAWFLIALPIGVGLIWIRTRPRRTRT